MLFMLGKKLGYLLMCLCSSSSSSSSSSFLKKWKRIIIAGWARIGCKGGNADRDFVKL